jgi:protein-disulfide isomerase
MHPIRPPRALLFVTCILLFIFASSTYFYAKTKLPPSIVINAKGQPTLGYAKARVHVVVFEEPKCMHCQELNNELFPVIKKEFIDTNKIRYTVIPVSFMPGSMPAAIASLCVYHQNSLYPNDELFFKYLDHIYKNQKNIESNWTSLQKLMEYAQATSPAIEINRLRSCVEMETYRVQIEENTAYGEKLMGGTIYTPTIYVNGIQLHEISIDDLRKLINAVLAHEGVE